MAEQQWEMMQFSTQVRLRLLLKVTQPVRHDAWWVDLDSQVLGGLTNCGLNNVMVCVCVFVCACVCLFPPVQGLSCSPCEEEDVSM